MSRLGLEVVILFALILANGVFSLSEIAVIAARQSRLQQRAREGDRRAGAALELALAPNLFLSTVQIGITLVGILSGAYGGATLADHLASAFERVPLLAEHSRGFALATVVAAVTYLSLILGELVPKRIALQDPERFASLAAKPMRFLSAAAAPAVRLLSASTDLVVRLLRVSPSGEPPVTEEEIKFLIGQGTRAGLFDEAEQEMVARVFRLGDRRVSALMTPRTEIVWLDVDDPPEDLRARMTQSGYSRFPAVQGSPENVLGIVQVKDLLTRVLAGEPLDLRRALKPPLFVPESMRALKIMEVFKQTGMHLALIIDEYGSLQGLVTFNDILEAIVGDITAPDEAEEPWVVQREDGSWLIDGMLPIDELQALFPDCALDEEEGRSYQTLGGLVMMRLGRIPAPADHFEGGGLRFEVMDMDGNRVDKVLVSRLVPEEPGAEEA